MISGDLPMRRAADHGEPSNREIMGKLEIIEKYIARHTEDHDALSSRLASDDVSTALSHAQLVSLMRMTDEIAGLRDFRVQVTTIGSSVKWVVGGSLLTALVSIMTLVTLVAHTGGTP